MKALTLDDALNYFNSLKESGLDGDTEIFVKDNVSDSGNTLYIDHIEVIENDEEYGTYIKIIGN